MADKLSKQARRRNMQAIKSTHTSLENRVISELWRHKYRFRRNVKSLPGKPDIAIKKYKIAIFIDSCFWHGCELHYKPPATNVTYWSEKLLRNLQRDSEINNYYRINGWHVLRVWEHDIKNYFEDTIKCIENFIDETKGKHSRF
ncbi:very short patch repair endonuclease [Methanoculleus sp. UBA430]|uniref:very short patch repair endonuclease n=1 Tax=Methanoculleus sp. UBA430 TaxID=1915511 RepID=UPI0025FE5952|nr:very short patch repair endonuclease [Methanoculleus sp. UBA430]